MGSEWLDNEWLVDDENSWAEIGCGYSVADVLV